MLKATESAEYIAKISKHVKIQEDRLEKVCEGMLSSVKDNKLAMPDTGTNISYINKDDSRAVDLIFVSDALNFCFWSYPGAEKWTVDGHTGYFALVAALNRAVKDGHDITNSEYYSKITEDQLRTIMKSSTETQIPLFEKRLSVLHEIGTILLEKFGGTFVNCLKEAGKSAVKLLEIIVENFPCFRDEAEYGGRKVVLYKRAQILIADIWIFYSGSGWGEFTDIDAMTAFADYRVPQVLAYYGVLQYNNDLTKKLENDVLLQSGSEEEVEIRGCCIHAVELIKKRMEDIIKRTGKDMEIPNSILVCNYLWFYRRKHSEELEKIPFHKTLGIFY